jgi:hypothetical protein
VLAVRTGRGALSRNWQALHRILIPRLLILRLLPPPLLRSLLPGLAGFRKLKDAQPESDARKSTQDVAT